jgi:hypothetical protein
VAAGIGVAVAIGLVLVVVVRPDRGGEGGRVVYVDGRGSDGNPGTRARPWRTLAHAFTRLQPGDTLLLRGGTYLERPTLSRSGTAGAPITVRSYPGETAVIDSGPAEFREPGNDDWELVDAITGEYRSRRPQRAETVYAYVDGIPGYENGRVLLVPYRSAAAFRATSDAYVDEDTPFYVGPGVYYDATDRRIHIRLAKTADLAAAEARYGKVFDGDLPDPRDYRILLSSAPTTLVVDGSHLVFRHLTVNQAEDTILLSRRAHDVTFDGITAWTGDRAIQAGEGGAHHVTVTRSRIYGDNPRWVFWSDMKNPPAPADLLRSTAVNLAGGAHDWEISYNHIRGSGQDLISTNTDERNILIHHNRLENCGDDALELEGTTDVGEVRVFENYIANCLTTVAAGQDSGAFSGPLYVFRNVMALLRDPPVNRRPGINSWNGGGRFGYEYLFKQHAGNTHIYQNTLVLLNSGGDGINLVPESPAGTYVANNLAVVVNGPVNGSTPTGPGQLFEGNLFWSMHPGGGAAGQGTDPRFAGFHPQAVAIGGATWALRPGDEVRKPTDFLLGGDSPAIGAGIAIPAHPELGRLPDTRASRDAGALPYGVPASEYDVFPFDPAKSPAN